MDRTGTATLYYRGAGEHNAIEKRVERRFAVDSNPQVLTFDVAQGIGGIESIELHFLSGDPAPRVAYLKIYSITAEAVDTARGLRSPVMALRGRAQLLGHGRVSGLACNDGLLGEMYTVEDDDPSFECRLPPAPGADPGSTLRLEATLEYLPGDEYIAARDRFLAETALHEERIRDLESKVAALGQDLGDLERCRASPLWRGFVTAQACLERIGAARRAGLIRSGLKVFDPAWWARRNLTDYERWRSARGYSNRPQK